MGNPVLIFFRFLGSGVDECGGFGFLLEGLIVLGGVHGRGFLAHL